MKPTRYLVAAAVLATTAHAINTNATAQDATATRRLDDGVFTYRMKGVDIVGRDGPGAPYIPGTRESCFQTALNDPATQASGASWSNYEGGACWLKYTDFQFVETTPNVGVDSVLKLRTDSGDVRWSEVKEGVDMPGYDIDRTWRGPVSMDQCKVQCAEIRICYAVVWTDYNGGTCWFKSHATSYVAVAGAKSAYLARRIESI